MGTQEVKKPPIGICPKNIWLENVLKERQEELKAAIIRYIQADFGINEDWLNELMDIREKLIRL